MFLKNIEKYQNCIEISIKHFHWHRFRQPLYNIHLTQSVSTMWSVAQKCIEGYLSNVHFKNLFMSVSCRTHPCLHKLNPSMSSLRVMRATTRFMARSFLGIKGDLMDFDWQNGRPCQLVPQRIFFIEFNNTIMSYTSEKRHAYVIVIHWWHTRKSTSPLCLYISIYKYGLA